MSTAPTLPPLPAMYCGPDTGHVNIWLAEDLRAWGEACATAHTSALAQRVEALERDLAAMTTAHAVAVELGATYAARVDVAADEVGRPRGESAVLIGLLTDCAAVLRTIDPSDSDEAEKLSALLTAIDRAQAPSRHKGALL